MSESSKPSSESDYTSLAVSELTSEECYKFLTGAIVPRPIAWVSTIGNDGTPNLASFSFYNGVCSDPMCLMISVQYQPNGDLKDTARNILENGEFVVHESPLWAIEEVHDSSTNWEYAVSEIAELGLTTLPSTLVKPPRIAESPIHMECRLLEKVELGRGSILFVGEIVQLHILRRAYQKGRVLLDEIRPVARMAGPTYMEVGETFGRVRPKG